MINFLGTGWLKFLSFYQKGNQQRMLIHVWAKWIPLSSVCGHMLASPYLRWDTSGLLCSFMGCLNSESQQWEICENMHHGHETLDRIELVDWLLSNRQWYDRCRSVCSLRIPMSAVAVPDCMSFDPIVNAELIALIGHELRTLSYLMVYWLVQVLSIGFWTQNAETVSDCFLSPIPHLHLVWSSTNGPVLGSTNGCDWMGTLRQCVPV